MRRECVASLWSTKTYNSGTVGVMSSAHAGFAATATFPLVVVGGPRKRMCGVV